MEETIECKKNEIRSVFRNQNFLFLFIGKFISMMGDQIYIFALGWYILSITKSGAKMGMLLAIGLLPAVIVGPFAGVIADRFNRKNIIVIMDLARFAIVLTMAFLLQQGLLYLWVLYLGTALLEICGAIFNPAASAIIPNIVEENQYTQAASMDQLIWSTCIVLGMLTGGILFGLLGIAAIFVINAISFLLSGILEFSVKAPKQINQGAQAKSSILDELASGYRFLKNNKGLFAVYIYFAVINFLLLPIGNIYIPYVFNVLLKSSSIQLAVVQASFFIGMIIGAVVMPRFLDKIKVRKTLITSSLIVVSIELLGSVTVTPILMKSLSIWTIAIIFVGLSVLLGVSMSLFNIQIQVIFQRKVSDDVRGRVSALVSALVSGIIPVSYLISGFMANNIPIYLIMVCTSFSLLLSIAILSKVKAVNEL